MKRINKIFLWVFIVIAVFFIVANIALSMFAKQAVVDQIEQNLKLRSSLGSLTISFPLSINLNDLQIGDLFKADHVSVSPNLLGFLAGKIVLNKVSIINPVINLDQNSDGALNLPKLEQKGNPPEVYLASLAVRNAKFIFTDKKIKPAGLKTILGRINADISKVAFPLTSLKTNFRVSADFLTPEDKQIGSFIFSGWLDYQPKDLDADLAVKDMDITYFSPYYGSFLSSKKLLSARLDLKTSFKSRNNNLDILSNFQLSHLIYASRNEELIEGVPSLNLARNALDLFTDTNGNLKLDFNINTKLDNPNLTIEQIEKIILKAAAKNLSSQSPEVLIKKVSDNIDEFQAFGKSIKGIFKGN